MSSYLVHKAAEVSSCKKAVAAILSHPGYLENHYRAFAKYDGCCVIAIIEGLGVQYLSRTGEKANLSHLDVMMVERFGDPYQPIVVLGEAWWPGKGQFPQISGAFRRHSGDVRLQFVAYDLLTWEEYSSGVAQAPFRERFKRLEVAFKGHPYRPGEVPVSLAHQYSPDDYVTAKRLAGALVERGGYDGLIMRDPEAGWTKGHSGNDGAIIKVKHRVSIDVRCTEVVEGKGKKAGMAGALKFFWKGGCEVGTGMSDAERRHAWECPDEIVGKIIEVECLGFTPDGKPREPSFKGCRFDKLKADNE